MNAAAALGRLVSRSRASAYLLAVALKLRDEFHSAAMGRRSCLSRLLAHPHSLLFVSFLVIIVNCMRASRTVQYASITYAS